MKYSSLIFAALTVASTAQAGEFKLSSEEFSQGRVQEAQFADQFGCNGQNQSPALSWSGAPDGTKSFIITMYDRDAPTGSGWWHWVVIDVPANLNSVAAGAGSSPQKLPKGAHAMRGDVGDVKFLGACPPPGETHHYTITIKALGVDKLPVPADASPAMVGFVSNMNKLGEASIVAEGKR